MGIITQQAPADKKNKYQPGKIPIDSRKAGESCLINLSPQKQDLPRARPSPSRAKQRIDMRFMATLCFPIAAGRTVPIPFSRQFRYNATIKYRAANARRNKYEYRATHHRYSKGLFSGRQERAAPRGTKRRPRQTGLDIVPGKGPARHLHAAYQ